jgi:cysteinyl-tRNA synthetase, unknown class
MIYPSTNYLMPNNLIPAGTAPNYGSGWSFSITKNELNQLLQNPAKLLVLDYSHDGAEARRYQPTEIDALHNNGQQALSYLSIGESSNWRYYFQNGWKTNPPGWQGKENPDWPGSSKVKYWDPDWQKITLEYLDKIIDSGFDGAYLDIVDAFDYWSNPKNGEGLVLDRADAAKRMIDWVEKIVEHARVDRGKPNFHVIPQNAEALLPYDTTGKFLKEISGVGVESLYFNGVQAQDPGSIAGRSANLNKVVAAGKPVLVIDYINDGSGYQGSNKVRIDSFWQRANLAGYTPQVNPLDRTTLTLDPLNNQLLLAQKAQSVSSPAVTPPAAIAPPVTTVQAAAKPIEAPVASPVPQTTVVQAVAPSVSVGKEGTANNDLLEGGQLIDRLFGADGDDTIKGFAGNDYLVGGRGADRIEAGDDWDMVYGEWGDDSISGGNGNDLLWGNDDNDTLFGDAGDDRLCGDRGDDVLTGGAGKDIFVYENFDPRALGRDTITDFEAGVDKIELRANIFTELAGKNWSFAVVDSNQAARSSSAQIIYNQTNGNLFYNDPGDAPAVNFANLSSKPVLSAADFQVF